MNKMKKLARRAIARELAAEELERVAGGAKKMFERYVEESPDYKKKIVAYFAEPLTGDQENTLLKIFGKSLSMWVFKDGGFALFYSPTDKYAEVTPIALLAIYGITPKVVSELLRLPISVEG